MKNTKSKKALVGALAILGVMALATAVQAAPPRPTTPQIYVTGQNLVYDTIVLGALPMEGPFQLLVPTSDGLETEFGPGDVGYLGGRWWIDVNGDGKQNMGDVFFLCPLLGNGYEL